MNKVKPPKAKKRPALTARLYPFPTNIPKKEMEPNNKSKVHAKTKMINP
ncbi:MAG: hypothetical protein ABR909_05435 [Candidatus Bathyarchaeia archaeon]|jgi:hypothetical protein